MDHLMFVRRHTPLLAIAAMIVAACDRPPSAPPDAPSELAGPEAAVAPAIYGVGALHRAAPNPCRAPEYREFDFQLGKWEARDPETGRLLGFDEMTSELGGCIQMEDFIAPNGFRSRYVSVYDREADVWRRTFVSSNTTNIRFSGARVGSNMEFESGQLAFDVMTGRVRFRISNETWFPNRDGTMTGIREGAFEGDPLTAVTTRFVPVPDFEAPPELSLPICMVNTPFRTLDFWLGQWEVAATEGPELGTSEVVGDLSGCLIEEHFAAPNGYRSRSFVYFDFVIGTWFRLLADVNGEVIELSGSVEDGPDGPRLIMTGRDPVPGGRTIDLRVTLTPDGDGGVLQTWEQSRDGGTDWKTTLELAYTAAG